MLIENKIDFFDHIVFAFSSPFSWAAVCAILSLEYFIPANKGQRILSRALANDSIWFIFESSQILLVTVYVIFVEKLYKTHLAWLTVQPATKIPYYVHFIWGLLLSDFLGWLHHWIRHKVAILWNFHTVLHSQKELNMFTDQRVHFVEYFVAKTIATVPMLMFGFSAPAIVSFNLFHLWYTKFYHANVRTNLGPQRFILVTPQSHRVHHAFEPQYRDKNFGVLLNVWDRLFGTHYKNDCVYPATSVHEHRVNKETANPFVSFLQQQWAPFSLLTNWLFSKP